MMEEIYPPLIDLDAPAPRHPAKYTDVLLPTMARMLRGRTRILEVSKTQKMGYNTGVVNQKFDRSDAGNILRSWPKPIEEVRTMFDFTPNYPQDLENYAPWVTTYGLTAPYGKCQAACGNDAPVARQSLTRKGYLRNQPTRFCCKRCAQAWLGAQGMAGGRFQKGNTAWNKGLHSYRSSPKTEFTKGQIPTNKLPVGSETIRTRTRDGRLRTYVKVAEPNVWRPRYLVVWEKHHGPVPKGFVVHHKDRNTLNDDIDNLGLMTRADHLKEHKPEFEEKRNVRATRARWGK